MLLSFPRPKSEWPTDRWLAGIWRNGTLVGVMCPSGFAILPAGTEGEIPAGHELLKRALDGLEGAQCVWLDISPVLARAGAWRIRLDPEAGIFYVLEPPVLGLEEQVFPARRVGTGPSGWIHRLQKGTPLPIQPERLALLSGALAARMEGRILVATFNGLPGKLILQMEGVSEETSESPVRFPFRSLPPSVAVVLPPEDLRDRPSLLFLTESSAEGRRMIFGAGILALREILAEDDG